MKHKKRGMLVHRIKDNDIKKYFSGESKIMGRELKRVPFDFDWPIGQIWKGYINPYKSMKCKSCDGTGLNEKTKKISDDWYSFDKTEWIEVGNGKRYNNLAWQYHLTKVEIKALLENDRLWNFTRMPINDKQREDVKKKMEDGGNSRLSYDNGYIPTPEEVNEWAKTGIGHDSLNQCICVRARAEHLDVYGNCKYCDGDGVIWQNEEIKKLHEEWKSFDPPKGEGFQLWETTTEGSPSSPIFKTLDELCEWCSINATTFANYKATKEEWGSMLDDNFISHKEGNIIFM